jgi:hypothetical protein
MIVNNLTDYCFSILYKYLKIRLILICIKVDTKIGSEFGGNHEISVW